MKNKNRNYLRAYVQKLKQKIHRFDQQWKGTRFASIQDSTIGIDEEDQNDYEQFLQKYRGKSGNIKPLGLIIYNRYLCSLFLLFLGLTLLYVPIMMVYSVGQGLAKFQTKISFSKSILLFSIANLPNYRLDDISEEQLSIINFHRYLTITTDIISIVVIFIFVLYLKITIAKITNEYMAQSPSPHLYCIQVQNIDGCNQQRINTHFKQFGRIAQMSPIYTHKNIIFDLRKIVKLISHLINLSPDSENYQDTLQQIQQKYKQIGKYYLSIPKPTLKSIFICFDQISTRNRVYDIYKYQINPEKLYIKYHQQKNNNSSTKLIQNKSQVMKTGQNIKIQQASVQNIVINPIVKKCQFEPLTINWENCDINQNSQNIKFCCQLVLLTIVAFVILLSLFLLHINSTQIKQQSIVSSIQNISESFINKQSRKKSQIRQKYTFCASLNISQFKWEYYNICAEYFEVERNKFILMLSFALMVAVINLLTNRILWALVAFRRYRTLAERNKFLITSIFLFSVINSAILILFVRGNHTGPILRAIVGKIISFPQDKMTVSVYSEFNRNWYLNIGSQLMMNFVVSLIVFPNFHIVLHYIRSKYRQFKMKRTHKQIKKPIFNYCTFYAMSLKAIFFSLMYSNSMPIFYFLCCMAVMVQIWLKKVLMKRFVDEPVFVDNNAIQVATNLIPYGLLLHCFTSILFLGVEELFPTLKSYYNINNNWMQANLLKFERGFVYIFLFVFLLIYIWNRRRIDEGVIKYWLGRSQQKAECDQTKKFKQIKNNPAFLSSYKMKDNPKYKILHYALQMFCAHMNKIRDTTKASKLLQHQFQISHNSIFTETNTTQKNIKKDHQVIAELEQRKSIQVEHTQFITQISNGNNQISISDFDAKSQQESSQQKQNDENWIVQQKTNQPHQVIHQQNHFIQQASVN